VPRSGVASRCGSSRGPSHGRGSRSKGRSRPSDLARHPRHRPAASRRRSVGIAPPIPGRHPGRRKSSLPAPSGRNRLWQRGNHGPPGSGPPRRPAGAGHPDPEVRRRRAEFRTERRHRMGSTERRASEAEETATETATHRGCGSRIGQPPDRRLALDRREERRAVALREPRQPGRSRPAAECRAPGRAQILRPANSSPRGDRRPGGRGLRANESRGVVAVPAKLDTVIRAIAELRACAGLANLPEDRPGKTRARRITVVYRDESGERPGAEA